MILKSSEKVYSAKIRGETVCTYHVGNYHILFDRPVNWELNTRIMNWAALVSGNEGLKEYARMQCIKRSSTFRIGPKGKKKPPTIVFRYGSQNEKIEEYMSNRRFLLRWLKLYWSPKKSEREECC